MEALSWVRPHNDYLWIFSEKGLFGILLFLGVFLMGFRYLFRFIRMKPVSGIPPDSITALMLIAGLLAFMADSAFSFPYERIDIMVLFIILVSAAISLHHQQSACVKAVGMPSGKIMLSIVILLFGFGIYYANSAIRLETNIVKAMRAVETENWHAVINHARAARTPLRGLSPTLVPVDYFEGLAYFSQAKNQDALPFFKEAHRQAPGNLRVLYLLSLTYNKMGRHAEARDCMLQIIAIAPQVPSTYINLASIYFEMGDYVLARDILMQSPERDTDTNIINRLRHLNNLLSASAEE